MLMASSRSVSRFASPNLIPIPSRGVASLKAGSGRLAEGPRDNDETTSSEVDDEPTKGSAGKDFWSEKLMHSKRLRKRAQVSVACVRCCM
jgi:hypothetical protein